jgi:hypothetical protein
VLKILLADVVDVLNIETATSKWKGFFSEFEIFQNFINQAILAQRNIGNFQHAVISNGQVKKNP